MLRMQMSVPVENASGGRGVEEAHGGAHHPGEEGAVEVLGGFEGAQLHPHRRADDAHGLSEEDHFAIEM